MKILYKNMMHVISDSELKNKPFSFSPEEIEYTLINGCPSLRILSKYQRLTAYLCVKYIVFGGIDEDNGDCDEDTWLSDADILCRQPHLSQEELIKERNKLGNKMER
jgi:hypothetical protein